MKTIGVFCFGEEPSDGPSGDPEVILASEGPEDVETSPPSGASLWLGVEDFLGLTALLLIIFWVSGLRACGSWHYHNAPQSQPNSQPSLHFQMGSFGHMLHRTQAGKK